MHKLRFFACFCLVSAASNTFFNGLLKTNPWQNVWVLMALSRLIFVNNKKPNQHAYSVDDQFHLTIFLVTKDATSFPVEHR